MLTLIIKKDNDCIPINDFIDLRNISCDVMYTLYNATK